MLRGTLCAVGAAAALALFAGQASAVTGLGTGLEAKSPVIAIGDDAAAEPADEAAAPAEGAATEGGNDAGAAADGAADAAGEAPAEGADTTEK